MTHKPGHKHKPSQKARNPYIDPSEMDGFKDITYFRDTEKRKSAP